ncbi:MAG: exodeoxyribonuclease III [Candidatus Omnitrophica bacterium]|nr:exodeoxyribonuclease III [Candidatus Omnitrophota bacterium]
MKKITILSWNVNGIRAVVKKNFLPWLKQASPDILCLQEIKATPSQLPPEMKFIDGYLPFWNPAKRLGYSGVATLSKVKPAAVKRGFGIPRFDEEGRVLETEFADFTLLNIYFPNGKMGPERLRYKMEFYDEALRYFLKLRRKGRRLVICGDVNTAHKPMDLAHPKENEKISGFLPQERAWMDKLVSHGFLDSFRVFNHEPNQYSWWDIRSGARARNVGWRIDYHFISEDLEAHLEEAFILPEVLGSDHCPVGVTLKFAS